ncbi:MAG: adenylyl-sulfate kinase [Magnetococcales bacterium]|nr:adenylyl-sulfate kinase [Magnetococcales bacterium]
MEPTPGVVYWLTGLSGAGKSTLAECLTERLRSEKPNVIALDGDVLRGIFKDGLGYDMASREQLALRYARLTGELARQGSDVVVSTISLFPTVWQWCRTHIAHYRLIYVRVPMSVLAARDRKQIYSRAQRGELSDVMGVDLPMVEPENPDLILDNSGHRTPDALVDQLIQAFILKDKQS